MWTLLDILDTCEFMTKRKKNLPAKPSYLLTMYQWYAYFLTKLTLCTCRVGAYYMIKSWYVWSITSFTRLYATRKKRWYFRWWIRAYTLELQFMETYNMVAALKLSMINVPNGTRHISSKKSFIFAFIFTTFLLPAQIYSHSHWGKRGWLGQIEWLWVNISLKNLPAVTAPSSFQYCNSLTSLPFFPSFLASSFLSHLRKRKKSIWWRIIWQLWNCYCIQFYCYLCTLLSVTKKNTS